MQEVRAQTFPKNPKPRNFIKPLLADVFVFFHNFFEIFLE